MREEPAAPKSHVSQQMVPVFLEAPRMTLGDAEEDGDWRSLGGRGRAGGRERKHMKMLVEFFRVD